MSIVERLIDHLLEKDYSIDTVQSIVEHLKISRDQLMKILADQRYEDFFQLLRSSKSAMDKIALTFDLFCCTHYGYKCKNASCPFLHLCPFDIRPMYSKCTNRDCQLEHKIERNVHNRTIIESRGLSFLSESLLLRVVRASADPNRSFWVCTDYPKNTCQKKNQCDRFHFCYFQLIDRCTKPTCQHTINPACQYYFRSRSIADHDQADIFQAFSKVLRQRKTDYLSTIRVASTRPKSDSRVVEPLATTTNENFNSEPSTPIPADDPNDLLLFPPENQHENVLVQEFLSRSIGCPIKLISQKLISSRRKTSDNSIGSIFYYAPISSSMDIFQQLRWQNRHKDQIKPLIVYSTIEEAHQHSEQNLQTHQYFLLRLEILDRTLFNNASMLPSVLQLENPSTMCFDRLWIYIYDF